MKIVTSNMGELKKSNDISMRWKEVEGYEGIYQISSLGLIFDIKRKKVIEPYPHQDLNFLYVTLYKKGEDGEVKGNEILYDFLFVKHFYANNPYFIV